MPTASPPPWDGLESPVDLSIAPASSSPKDSSTTIRLLSHTKMAPSTVAGVLEALGLELVDMHASLKSMQQQYEASYVVSGRLDPHVLQGLLHALQQALSGAEIRAVPSPQAEEPIASTAATSGSPDPWWGCNSPSDPVERIMSSPVHWISQEADLGQAKLLMSLYNCSSLMVDMGTRQPG
jgi:hypothetical protein